MRIWQPGIGGGLEATVARPVTYPPTFGWTRFDLPAPIATLPGLSYVIELDVTNDTWGWRTNTEAPPACSYPGGEEIFGGLPIPTLDAMFRTYTLCGNGLPDGGEECDDGNADGSDGCTTHCTVCGDGILAAPEECDDGNRTSGDGCDANCTVTACGNGILTAGEACDDGNLFDGDCCSAACGLDAPGTACVADTNPCTDDVCNGAGACTHPNNTNPCSDGSACNGADTCSGGSCSIHTGNPCASGPDCRRTCLDGGISYSCLADPSGTPCGDDGNACTTDACNGGGVCVHPPKPNGVACDDGYRCTSGDTCAGGVCQPGAPRSCGPCLTCDPLTGDCAPPRAPACTAAGSRGASLVLKSSPDPARNGLKWRWVGGGFMAKTDFGAPTAATDLTLCVFDQTGLKLSARAPGGGACAGLDCWLDVRAGYKYRDRDLTPDGVSKLVTKVSDTGKGKLSAKARGVNLGLRALGLVPPVTARLERNDAPACWESVFSVPSRNDEVQFKARSD